jgi:hypothetical protein
MSRSFVAIAAFALRAVLAIGMSALAFDAQAQSKSKPAPTPFPAPQVIGSFETVYAGTTTPITVRFEGRPQNPSINIVKKPSRGVLSEPRWVSRSVIELNYTPHSGVREGRDFFDLTVRSWNTEDSRPARVDIQILPRPAEVRHAGRLEFGSIIAGDTVSVVLEVTNTGGTPARLSPGIRAPWRLAGNAPADLQPGDTATLEIVFEPEKRGTFQDRLFISPDSKEPLRLEGTAREPLSWSPRKLAIPSDARSLESAGAAQRGTAEFRISNAAAGPRTVEIDWPPEIDAPRSLEIPPGQTRSISVRLQADAPPAFAFQGPVSLRGPGVSGSVILGVEPAPALLVIDPAEGLDLGEVDVEESATARVSISNRGGHPAELRINFGGGLDKSGVDFALEPPLSGQVLAPGETRSFEVRAKPLAAGEFSLPLKIFSGASMLAHWNVTVAARAAIPAQLEKRPVMAPEAASRLQAGATPAPQAPDAPPDGIPGVDEVFLVESTPHTIAFRWAIPSPDVKEFFIERRGIRAGGDGAPVEEWTRWEPVNIEVSGATATARFRKLPAGTFWHVRIRSVDSQGGVTASHRGFFRIATRPLPPLLPGWFWWVAAPLALALFYRLWKKLRAARVRNLDARIENLGPG